MLIVFKAINIFWR